MSGDYEKKHTPRRDDGDGGANVPPEQPRSPQGAGGNTKVPVQLRVGGGITPGSHQARGIVYVDEADRTTEIPIPVGEAFNLGASLIQAATLAYADQMVLGFLQASGMAPLEAWRWTESLQKYREYTQRAMQAIQDAARPQPQHNQEEG